MYEDLLRRVDMRTLCTHTFNDEKQNRARESNRNALNGSRGTGERHRLLQCSSVSPLGNDVKASGSRVVVYQVKTRIFNEWISPCI
jgi:hypothetical protein